ncbi:hypothetical protein [Heyndrickxia camelliae]|uniref:Calcineurin-like phosphoesterase domain-containing protein n=1 Tax=Heyndrickxia camelliae TaxID=1707093 RepID=A0A2N3LDZ0_9BACI|nr:hypothetical protein [Heyndrickxia camelliae]PKR82862.1 hypothetical protein CWO92_21980 [Heyndrickxia camelliae]
MTDILLRQKDESFLDYHIRLFENMDEYGLDKFKIADLLNEEYGSNYDESKWRKDYAQYVKWKEYIVSKSLDEERLSKYEESRLENEKEKIRNRDQKREYRKMITHQARFEQIKDDVYDAILELEKTKPLSFHPNFNKTFGDKHGLALFSDWHYGMEIDNSMNVFNKKVFNDRVEKLVSKIIEFGKMNNISTLHVAQLGDLVSGIIHVSTRVQANEDIIEQTKYVSEVLAEVLSRLANEFQIIKYYNVIGNHGRTGNKHDVGIKENFEYLIPWFLEARLREFNNIEIIVDKDGYITSRIFSDEIVFVHGNYDRVDQCVSRLPQVLGYVPSYIFGGHVHHNYEKEYGKTTVVINGSLIGADDYSMQGRYGAKPSQKFMIWDESEGLQCTYIIKLND